MPRMRGGAIPSDAGEKLRGMSPSILDYIGAHRKAILAAIGAVLVGIVDSATADAIIGGLDALLVLLVPNDEDAKRRVYRKR